MIKCNLKTSDILNAIEPVIKYSTKESIYLSISTKENLLDSCIIFVKEITSDLLNSILNHVNILVITENPGDLVDNYIKVKNTRLAMARILSLVSANYSSFDSINYVVSENTLISGSVIIEPFVYIGDNVEIGDNTVIKSGSKILSNTTIGKNCIIRENSIVGGQGFGVEKDEYGNNFKIPHLGGVKIGDHVEIGAINTIVSGTINPTIISDYTKIDDHVHIAHNCNIGRNCIITAGVILSGSVKLEDNSWIGPNSTVINSISIAQGTLVGIGSVVTKNILNIGKTYAGNPAKEFTQFIDEKRKYEFFISKFDEFKKLIIGD